MIVRVEFAENSEAEKKLENRFSVVFALTLDEGDHLCSAVSSSHALLAHISAAQTNMLLRKMEFFACFFRLQFAASMCAHS